MPLYRAEKCIQAKRDAAAAKWIQGQAAWWCGLLAQHMSLGGERPDTSYLRSPPSKGFAGLARTLVQFQFLSVSLLSSVFGLAHGTFCPYRKCPFTCILTKFRTLTQRSLLPFGLCIYALREIWRYI